jgi:hypothetical protein
VTALGGGEVYTRVGPDIQYTPHPATPVYLMESRVLWRGRAVIAFSL